MKIKHALIPLLLISCSACSFDRPSQIQNSRVEVVEVVEENQYETKKLDNYAIKALANDYVDAGDGEVEVTVTYDPKSKKNTAMNGYPR